MIHRSTTRTALLATAATALAASMLVATAGPGSAEGNVVFRDHFSGKDSHIEQEAHEDFCDVPYLVLWEGRFTVTEMSITRGGGDLEYFSFHVAATDTWTNVETGASFRQIGTFTGRDQKLTQEGSVLTIQAMDRFSTRVFDDDNRVVRREAGLRAVTLVIDIGDPANPDDDVLLDETITRDHGLREFGEGDFCDDVETFLG